MYELEIKYNGAPIATQKYVDFTDVTDVIERIDYNEMFTMLNDCLTLESLLANDKLRIHTGWQSVISCNVVYYDDDDATMVYEVYRMEVRI